jgi:ribonuclease P protein component
MMSAPQNNSINQNRATFKANERLKSKKKIDLVFSNGKAHTEYPVQVIFFLTKEDGDSQVQAGFSVPKRLFKHAVDRNRIKRLMRESYRKVKVDLKIDLHNKKMSLFLMWVYKSNEISKYALIEHKMKKTVIHLQQIINETNGLDQ